MPKLDFYPRRSWFAVAACGLVLGCIGDKLGDDCADRAMCPRDTGDDGTAGSSDGATGGGSPSGAGGATSGGTPTGSGGTMSTASGMGGMTGAGGVADGGTGGMGPECDTSASPSDEPCLVSDAFAVFVSPNGDDANDGTMADPVATFAHALELADADEKLVFACAGDDPYEEADTIVVPAAVPGIFGGFDCDDWTYDAERRAAVNVAVPQGLRADATTRLTLENLAVTASDATDAGSSSIGVIVSDSENVVLRRVTLTAGKGAPGDGGENGENGANGSEAGTPPMGALADCVDPIADDQAGGAWPSASACGSLGGAGGEAFRAASMNGGDGDDGTPTTNVVQIGLQNGGDGAIEDTVGGSGTAGSDGNRGTQGGAADEIGAFSATGYTPANGSDGGDGFPGQGGGGGGASKGNDTCLGASGGAGGMGGCGGGRGTGGDGGGASVALLSWSSDVTVEDSELVAGNAGDGGDGGDGGSVGLGQPGASGGTGDGDFGIRNGGRGGDGGNGGPGGSGSGGTGGPSIALAYAGVAPNIGNDSTLTPGLGGMAGRGGTVGAVSAPDGSDGMVEGMLDIE